MTQAANPFLNFASVALAAIPMLSLLVAGLTLAH